MSASAAIRPDLSGSEPFDEAVAVVVERERDRHEQCRDQHQVNIVARCRVSTLCREHPRAGETAERGNDREHPERHGTETEEIARDVLRKSRKQKDDETQNDALGFHDEPELAPDVRAHQTLHVVRAEPPTDREGRHRSQRQANRRIQEPKPLTEQVAAEDSGEVAGNGGNDDLKRLQPDEDDRRENPPLAKRVLEEALILIEPDDKLIGRSVAPYQPDSVSDERGGNRAAGDPP